METETYPNRSVPRIFTKYIHSIDKLFPILKIAVVVCHYILCYLQNIFYYGSKCEVVVTMTVTLNQASPRPPLPFLLKQQVGKTVWHTHDT